MKYKFPTIKTIDDIIPHVEHREEFVVAEREFGTVINYNVAFSNTFDMKGPDDLGGAIRRECRGIIFDRSGKIMSRPFHKFFNVGEREETLPRNLDVSKHHTVFEKMDGSMIRPIEFEGQIKLATKMGVTDIANDAHRWLKEQQDCKEKLQWLENTLRLGITPIFEWVAPYNKIVVDYNEEDIVLLALRDNVTGEYHKLPHQQPFTTAPTYGRIDSTIDQFLQKNRQQEGREGVVIEFENGHKVKAKNDWYVRLHKVMDQLRYDRHVIDLILNGEIDDVIPMLPKDQVVRCQNLENSFWDCVDVKTTQLNKLRITAHKQYNDDKKRVAIELVPTLNDKVLSGMLFKMVDGKGDALSLITDHISKSLTTNTKWDKCAEWLEIKQEVRQYENQME